MRIMRIIWLETVTVTSGKDVTLNNDYSDLTWVLRRFPGKLNVTAGGAITDSVERRERGRNDDIGSGCGEQHHIGQCGSLGWNGDDYFGQGCDVEQRHGD